MNPYTMALIVAVGTLLFAGCVGNSNSTAGKFAGKAALGTLNAFSYKGASRNDILNRLDYFPHYGIDGEELVIGFGNGYPRTYDNLRVIRNDAFVMNAPVWEVNFRLVPGTRSRYKFDRLTFDKDGYVDDFETETETLGQPL